MGRSAASRIGGRSPAHACFVLLSGGRRSDRSRTICRCLSKFPFRRQYTNHTRCPPERSAPEGSAGAFPLFRVGGDWPSSNSFVTGHDFSRAATPRKTPGLQPLGDAFGVMSELAVIRQQRNYVVQFANGKRSTFDVFGGGTHWRGNGKRRYRSKLSSSVRIGRQPNRD
jgi:hypothetical protein